MTLPKIKLPAGIWISGAIVTVLVAIFGWVLLLSGGAALARYSFDFPFAWRSGLKGDEVVIIYMDENSATNLGQPVDGPWDRRIHAQLLDRLTAEGAKAVVFDILMTGPRDPAADKELERAIRQNGRVILPGSYHNKEEAQFAGVTVAAPDSEYPYPLFAAAAAGWGNCNFMRDDGTVRISFPTITNDPHFTNVYWMPWVAATVVGARVTKLEPPPNPERWINYYGPPVTLPFKWYSDALAHGKLPAGFFKDKVVFIGANYQVGEEDKFRTAYTRWDKNLAPGVEIHATAFLNLLHGDWLVRLPFAAELGLVILCAAAVGFGLLRLRPLPATFVTILAMLALVAAAVALQWYGHIWFSWAALLLQLMVGLFCSVVYNSLKIYIEKRLVEESLAAWLSPAVARLLLKDEKLRQPGGDRHEISILFSDIANFSRVSESMDPDDLIHHLNQYFGTALECIHETDGTVMDLIGDAIFAIWNAPVQQADHRERACLAALKLHEQIVNFDATQNRLPMRTRVGLHTGTVCVGNIGSKTRFNYTALGKDINLASRLEGLNKHFGTDVLATRSIQRAVEGKIVCRLVGHIKVKGGGAPVEIHELLGTMEKAEASRLWREKFAEALQLFRNKKWDAAESAFRETIALRKAVPAGAPGAATCEEGDGPSHFYLKQIADFRLTPPSYEWIGDVSLSEK